MYVLIESKYLAQIQRQVSALKVLSLLESLELTPWSSGRRPQSNQFIPFFFVCHFSSALFHIIYFTVG